MARPATHQRVTCSAVRTCTSVRLSPTVVMVAAFPQHAMGPVWERGEEASRGGRLQACRAVGAGDMGCWTRLWKDTGAASAHSHAIIFCSYSLDSCWPTACLPRNCRTLVRVLLWAALVLGRRVPCPSETLNISKPNICTHT